MTSNIIRKISKFPVDSFCDRVVYHVSDHEIGRAVASYRKVVKPEMDQALSRRVSAINSLMKQLQAINVPVFFAFQFPVDLVLFLA